MKRRFEDPNDPTYVKIAYAFRNNNTVPMRVNIARCLLSNDITTAGNWSTRSSDLSSFPAGLEFLWPTGVSGDPDSGYTSIPRLDQANGLIFYGARQGGSSTPYTSVCVKSYTENL